VKSPSPSVKNIGKPEQALLTNHKPEPRFRWHPSKSFTLAELPIMYCSSTARRLAEDSPGGTLKRTKTGLADLTVIQYVCALVRRCSMATMTRFEKCA
uniref:PINIT domain-containing protein n=1 Tax=Mesocestoides corti TaxID=53468 RepID=A0A5K3G0V7_MESCO